MMYETVWHGGSWREIAPPVIETPPVVNRRKREAALRREAALARGRKALAERQKAKTRSLVLAALGDGEADVKEIMRRSGMTLSVLRKRLREIVADGWITSRNEKVRNSTTYRKLYRRVARTEAA